MTTFVLILSQPSSETKTGRPNDLAVKRSHMLYIVRTYRIEHQQVSGTRQAAALRLPKEGSQKVEPIRLRYESFC